MASRLYEILRKDVFSDIETGPCFLHPRPQSSNVSMLSGKHINTVNYENKTALKTIKQNILHSYNNYFLLINAVKLHRYANISVKPGLMSWVFRKSWYGVSNLIFTPMHTTLVGLCHGHSFRWQMQIYFHIPKMTSTQQQLQSNNKAQYNALVQQSFSNFSCCQTPS